ncbi:MAG: insulinase family protein, partial [Parasporobacterium sp.]|nr:insulinase family protein [Parasporobacterium sp.]
RAGRFVDSGDLYKGSVQVFLTIMRYEYLWFNIRVQGGAYGCMCTGSANGISAFITYRDPHIKRSYDVFEGIPDFLESFDADETEMTKYVLGTMSGKDAPMTPYIKGVKALNEYICKSTKELRQRERDEIINCTAEDIRALAPYIRKALSAGNVCVIGNGTKVDEDKELFKEVRNLFEQV